MNEIEKIGMERDRKRWFINHYIVENSVGNTKDIRFTVQVGAATSENWTSDTQTVIDASLGTLDGNYTKMNYTSVLKLISLGLNAQAEHKGII